jgi:hypothetical protein
MMIEVHTVSIVAKNKYAGNMGARKAPFFRGRTKNRKALIRVKLLVTTNQQASGGDLSFRLRDRQRACLGDGRPSGSSLSHPEGFSISR